MQNYYHLYHKRERLVIRGDNRCLVQGGQMLIYKSQEGPVEHA